MKDQATSRNVHVIAACSSGNTNKTALTNLLGATSLNVRRVLAGAILAVATVAMIQPAQAGLSGEDLIAAQAFIATYPGMRQDQKDLILNANSLQQASDFVHGNTYWDGYNNIKIDTAALFTTQVTPTVLTKTQPPIDPNIQINIDTKQNTDIAKNTAQISALENEPKPTNGIDGKNGLNGADGKDGAKGDTGADGKEGADGKDGAKGDTGATGATGQKGDAGADGKEGADGKDGAKGDTGANGLNGTDADMSKVLAAQQTADHAQTTAKTAQETAENTDKQAVIRNSDKIQGMLHAKTQAEINAAVKSVRVPASAQQNENARITRMQIAAQSAEIEAIEQNHAEVLAESHARAYGDEQTLQESQDYTNHKFADLKSQVDDNKKQAAGVLLPRWLRRISLRFRNHSSLLSVLESVVMIQKTHCPWVHPFTQEDPPSLKCLFPMIRKAMSVMALASVSVGKHRLD